MLDKQIEEEKKMKEEERKKKEDERRKKEDELRKEEERKKKEEEERIIKEEEERKIKEEEERKIKEEEERKIKEEEKRKIKELKKKKKEEEAEKIKLTALQIKQEEFDEFEENLLQKAVESDRMVFFEDQIKNSIKNEFEVELMKRAKKNELKKARIAELIKARLVIMQKSKAQELEKLILGQIEFLTIAREFYVKYHPRKNDVNRIRDMQLQEGIFKEMEKEKEQARVSEIHRKKTAERKKKKESEMLKKKEEEILRAKMLTTRTRGLKSKEKIKKHNSDIKNANVKKTSLRLGYTPKKHGRKRRNNVQNEQSNSKKSRFENGARTNNTVVLSLTKRTRSSADLIREREEETLAITSVTNKLLKKNVLRLVINNIYESNMYLPPTEKHVKDLSFDGHSVVKQPVDVKCIRKQIGEGSIQSISDIQINLMILSYNAIMINKTKTKVFSDASDFQEKLLSDVNYFRCALATDEDLLSEKKNDDNNINYADNNEESCIDPVIKLTDGDIIIENCDDDDSNDIECDEAVDDIYKSIGFSSNDSCSDSESDNSLPLKNRRKTVHSYANTSDSNIDSDDYGCSDD